MSDLIENLGGALLRLCNQTGYIGATIVVTFILWVLAYVAINRNCDNATISILLRGDYDQLYTRRKGNMRELSNSLNNLLIANGYSMFSPIATILIKSLGALLYGKLLCSEAMNGAVLNGFTVLMPQRTFDIIKDDQGFGIFFVCTFAAGYVVLEMLTRRSLSSVTLIDGKEMDIAIIVIGAAVCIVSNLGAEMIMLLFTLGECVYTMMRLKLKTVREKHIKKIEPNIKHYNFEKDDKQMVRLRQAQWKKKKKK